MLSLLHIENIAVIERADITFAPGFNVLTGETGAGKSIVIDAIGAIIGERTSRDLIRTGAKTAVVSGIFRDIPALDWFQTYGTAPDENGELLIQRELHQDGKNSCRVNGRPVTVAQLRALGSQLLNIHGQHDGQLLLDPVNHLGYLDSFGGTEQLLSEYSAVYKSMAELRHEINKLRMNEAEKSRRVDTLNFQIRELEQAALKPGEDEELNERRNLMRSAGKLNDALNAAFADLRGAGGGEGAVSMLQDAEGELHTASRYTQKLLPLTKVMSELTSLAVDAAEQVRELLDEFSFEPDELDRVESRLDQIYRLKKKYGTTVEEMLEFLEDCRTELSRIESADDTIARLKQKLLQLRDEAKARALALSAERKRCASLLEKRIEKELSELDMPRIKFIVTFSEKPGAFGMDETGMDEVQFLMSANIGEEPKPIQKIASGGELARIMLALKNVLAENEAVSTMVFDEVDTGVSGRAAEKVARKMAAVASFKQVLCVTHLPQIAAMADTHFSVEKGEDEQRTYTVVRQLSREGRREELARLTGGSNITSNMLVSAEELLSDADHWKAAAAAQRNENP